MTTGRCFANRGKRRPLPWRWPLHGRGLFTWNEWAATLAEEIKRAQAGGDPDTGETYYRHWLATLERLIAEKGVATSETLHRYRDAWDHAARPHAARFADRIEAGRFWLDRRRCEERYLRRPLRIFPPALWRAARRPDIRRSHNPSHAARRARRDSRCGSVRGSGRPALPRQVHSRASRCWPCPATSAACAIRTVLFIPRLSAACNALMVSSRQSG